MAWGRAISGNRPSEPQMMCTDVLPFAGAACGCRFRLSGLDRVKGCVRGPDPRACVCLELLCGEGAPLCLGD